MEWFLILVGIKVIETINERLMCETTTDGTHNGRVWRVDSRMF